MYRYTISMNRSVFDEFRSRCKDLNVPMANAVDQLVLPVLDDVTTAKDLARRIRTKGR